MKLARFTIPSSNPLLSLWWATPTARISQTATATAVTRLRHVRVYSCFPPGCPPAACSLFCFIFVLFYFFLFFSAYYPALTHPPSTSIYFLRYREDSQIVRQTVCRLLLNPVLDATITSLLVVGAVDRGHRCVRTRPFALFLAVL